MPVISEVDDGIVGNVVPGPCDWAIDTTCIPGWETDYTNAQRSRAISWATFMLDTLTGHQFAQCPITVRPCGTGCGVPSYTTWPVGSPANSGPGPWMTPYIVNGLWRNCGCRGGCDCSPACKVDLGRPVAQIDQVKVNGLVLTDTAYALVGQWLARTDGGECWPSCQDPAVPDTQTGTFSVTFRPGRALPVAGQVAAGLLAGEFIQACKGAACALPANISSLTRQGVDVQFVDPSEVLAAGKTGIREVDLFIEAVNPSGMKRRSRVYSPDLPAFPVRYA
jgi:hypothetical protein